MTRKPDDRTQDEAAIRWNGLTEAERAAVCVDIAQHYLGNEQQKQKILEQAEWHQRRAGKS